MRIAVTGTHGVGKSTLTEDLALRLPGYRVVEEPYYLLAERGHEFSESPTIDEYLLMLRQSLAVMRSERRDVIFDRCPLDYLAYIYALRGAAGFDLGQWQPAIERAIGSLDLLVFVPITSEADAQLPLTQHTELRMSVDDYLHELIVEDSLGVCDDVEVVELLGPLRYRTEQVMARVVRLLRRSEAHHS